MLKELEKLLQEIAQNQGAPASSQRPASPAQQRAAQRHPAGQKHPTLEPVDADIILAEPVHQSVTAHVQSDIDTTDLTGHAKHLGQQVGQADDKMDARVHQKFDHDISQIDDEPSVWDTAPAASAGGGAGLASEVAAMLRSPNSIRQAVILSELLSRPEDRW